MLKGSKAASVSMNERFICVETYSGRGLMGRDPGGVCEFHGLDVPESILGDSLRRALEASRWMTMEEYPVFFDGEHSKQVNQAWIERAIERFGSRTDVAIYKKMVTCSVRSQDGLITIRPSVHVKPKAWSGDAVSPSEYVELATSSTDVALGDGLRSALARCK
jgi:hypothetical protein